jgi:hypothetical protein
MTTYSQLVDEMIAESKRPDMATEIQAYVNQTIREVHFEPQRGNSILYNENLIEASLTADVETGFTWAPPNPAVFQSLAAVKYPTIVDRHGRDIWATEKTPGRGLVDAEYFYYRAAGGFAFSDYGGVDATIAIAYYEYPKRLKYYASAVRPATWDDEDGWTYHEDYDTDDDSRLLAETLVSNWLLLRWHDVLSEGVRAKIYKRVADTERARTAYSSFTTLRQGLYTSEAAAAHGAW